MGIHISEATVDPHGRVVLDHLPFRPGEKVDIVIKSHPVSPVSSGDLKGSVLRYENPFDPVAMDPRPAAVKLKEASPDLDVLTLADSNARPLPLCPPQIPISTAD